MSAEILYGKDRCPVFGHAFRVIEPPNEPKKLCCINCGAERLEPTKGDQMTIQEIKAGQRWESIAENYIVIVEWADGRDVLIRWSYGSKLDLRSVDYFLAYFKRHIEPKTRPITKDDIMKMLAVNPVVFMRPINKCGTIAFWSSTNNPVVWLENTKNNLSGYQYSHNPFAPNPVIVGPTVTDEAGE